MKISVITASIRPAGLDVAIETLKHQTFTDFEHITKLSEVGPKPDLCASLNDCIRRSSGELLVFLQDHTVIPPDGLERCWAAYEGDKDVGWTFPLGKVDDLADPAHPRWDWRVERPDGSYVAWNEWETDYACIPRRAIIEVGGFDEDFDSGFSWDNVEIGYRLFKSGMGFRVDTRNRAVAWDHDKFVPHPYRHKPNLDLWTGKRREIDAGKIKMPYLN